MFSIIKKGLEGLSNEQGRELLHFPANYVLGQAADDGGCFFDSLAQSLNQLRQTDIYDEKFLRILCHDYYYEHKTEVDAWNEADYGGVDRDEDYAFIQYTQEELKQLFNDRSPIWGRPFIEGRILCRKLDLPTIIIVELLKDPDRPTILIPAYYKATQEDYQQLATNKLTDEDFKQFPVLVVHQGALYFVPALSQAKVLQNNKPKSDIETRSSISPSQLLSETIKHPEACKPLFFTNRGKTYPMQKHQIPKTTKNDEIIVPQDDASMSSVIGTGAEVNERLSYEETWAGIKIVSNSNEELQKLVAGLNAIPVEKLRFLSGGHNF